MFDAESIYETGQTKAIYQLIRPIKPIRFNFVCLRTAGKFKSKTFIVLIFKSEGLSGSVQPQK